MKMNKPELWIYLETMFQKQASGRNIYIGNF